MSHKSTSKPSRSYSAETSSTGGNNHRGTTTYSSSTHASTAEDPLQRFFVSGESSGRGAASASRQLNQWDRHYAAASTSRR